MVTVGLFDSGMGGLTVAREVRRQMPYANIEYYGDNGRVPYAPLPREEIARYSRQIVDFLGTKNVDLVIIACNTATAAALESLEGQYPFPVIGVIGPGAEAALAATKNKRIGVIATQFTTDNRAYAKVIEKIDPEATVIGQACPMFTTLVEADKVDSPEAAHFAAEYLSVYKDKDIDTLVLGCTHYPIMIDHVKRNISPKVSIVDPAVATVKQAKDLLQGKAADSSGGSPQYRFYTSGDPVLFEKLGSSIFGAPTGTVEKVTFE
ncbi:MAG: glutamate racemase [Bacillota bacterium]|jgi:glutamate racemase